jgi:hypothetical protein
MSRYELAEQMEQILGLATQEAYLQAQQLCHIQHSPQMPRALPLPSTHIVFLLNLAPAPFTLLPTGITNAQFEPNWVGMRSRTRDTHPWASCMSADDEGEDMIQHPAITHRQIGKLIVLVKCNIGRSFDWSIQELYIDITPNNVSEDPEVMWCIRSSVM